MILVYDTETDGLTHDDLPDSHPSQPHLVQLAAQLYEPDGTEISSIDLIVRPDGWIIPKTASDIHGITTEIATCRGLPLLLVVAVFTNLRALADTTAAHNASFDRKVIDVACARLGKQPAKGWPETSICTKDLAAPLVNLPPTPKMLARHMMRPKPPTLTEAYAYFFGTTFDGAHGANADSRAAARILFHILKGGGKYEHPMMGREG